MLNRKIKKQLTLEVLEAYELKLLELKIAAKKYQKDIKLSEQEFNNETNSQILKQHLNRKTRVAFGRLYAAQNAIYEVQHNIFYYQKLLKK